jgi:hypothetical protein
MRLNRCDHDAAVGLHEVDAAARHANPRLDNNPFVEDAFDRVEVGRVAFCTPLNIADEQETVQLQRLRKGGLRRIHDRDYQQAAIAGHSHELRSLLAQATRQP